MPRYPISKATRKELTDDEVLRARGLQGSKIFHKRRVFKTQHGKYFLCTEELWWRYIKFHYYFGVYNKFDVCLKIYEYEIRIRTSQST